MQILRLRSRTLPEVAWALVALSYLPACIGDPGKSGEDSAGSDEQGGDGGSPTNPGAGSGEPVDGLGYGVPADTTILLVLDTSASMREENQAVSTLIESLANVLAAGGAEHWRVGITTASVEYQDGPTENIDPGEAGTLLGPVIDENTADPGGTARYQVLCKGTAWDPGELEFDGDHVCGEPAGATMSELYLDCTCGSGGWNTRPGSGNEEPLEAVRTATCQADSSSLSGCSGEAEIHPGLLAGGDILVLSISDEGDNSRALSMGDGDPGWYQEALTPTQGSLVWSTIGPGYDPETGTLLCNDGAAVSWGIERLQGLSAVTGGTYSAIRDESSPDCALADLQTLFDGWWATAVGSLTAGG